ncbi:MAG TPA: PAS domain S-box protein [Pyrinomonadaceae bacterium]|jgi:PAS domain S-box-containing protein
MATEDARLAAPTEERFHAVLEQAPFSVQIVAPDGRTLRVNRAWEELWGVTLAQLGDYNMLADAQLAEKGVLPYLQRAFAGEAVEIPPILYDPNETIPNITTRAEPQRWVRAVAYPIKDERGRVREIVLMHEDITARVRAEERLRQSEERYRALFETTPDGIMIVDDEGRYVEVNESLCRILKAPRAQLVGAHFSQFMLPERTDEAHAAFVALRDTGAYVGSFPMRAADGSTVELEWSSRAHFVPGLHMCVARDVTARGRAEAELRRSEERYRSLLENANDIIYAHDLQGNYLSINRAGAEITGYTRDEILGGLNIAQVVVPEHLELAREMVARKLTDPTPTVYEIDIRAKDGRRLTLEVSTRISWRDGRPVAVEGVARDVTERKRVKAERARLAAQLDDQRRHLQAMVASVPGVVWEAWGQPDAAAQRIDFVSDYVEQLLGYTVAEWLATPNFWLTVVHPEDRERAARNAAEHYARGGNGVNRFRWVARDGRVLWVESQSSVIADEAGRPLGMRGVTMDISERVRQETNERFLAEASTALSSSLDYETTLATVAKLAVPHFADWCGVEMLDESGTLKRLAVAHVDPAKVAWAHELAERYPADPNEPRGIYQVLRTGESEFYPEIPDELLVAGARDAEHLRILRQIGFRSAMLVPLKTREQTLGVLSFINSESGRHHTLEDLALAEDLAARAALAVDNARLYRAEQRTRRAAEVTADRLARLQNVSAALSQALTPQQVCVAVIGQGISSLDAHAGSVVVLSDDGAELELVDAVGFPPELLERWRRFPLTSVVPIADAVRTKLPVLIESFENFAERYPTLGPLASVTGSRALLALPLIVKGRTIGAMGLAFPRPRTFGEEERGFMLALAQQCAQALERARLYETEQRLRAEAEAANRLKDEFLATVSHELRTPLTAIVGWAGMLRGGQFDPLTTARAVETIERNAKAQAQIIEDLLDVSRIITGKLSLDARAAELGSIIEAAVEAVRPAAAVKGLTLKTDIARAVGAVWGDPTRLQQVLWNLLTNAVKFTPPGGEVCVRLARAGAHLRIVVTDTGQGISPDFLPYVFDRFRQADGSITRRHGGLGLGLAIVRHLIDMHGGTVAAASAGEGRGATFTVELPLMAAADETPRLTGAGGADQSVKTPPSLEGVQVLVVDDEPDALLLLTTIIEQRGARVVAVTSAAEALTALKEFQPDVLVSDIGLPGVDGYALMRQVRALDAQAGGRVPAVALTAYAREEDRLRALLAGYQVHLAKPINPAELLVVLSGLAGVTTARK